MINIPGYDDAITNSEFLLRKTDHGNGVIQQFDELGVEFWTLNGELHRIGNPAVIHPDGSTYWFVGGRLHRTNGPAVTEYCDGKVSSEAWYQHGLLHRDGGPAKIFQNGIQYWYQHGLLHRDGGPAIIRSDRSYEFYQHGKRHRTDGPAVRHADGSEWWYENDVIHRAGNKPAAEFPGGKSVYYEHGKVRSIHWEGGARGPGLIHQSWVKVSIDTKDN